MAEGRPVYQDKDSENTSNGEPASEVDKLPSMENVEMRMPLFPKPTTSGTSQGATGMARKKPEPPPRDRRGHMFQSFHFRHPDRMSDLGNSISQIKMNADFLTTEVCQRPALLVVAIDFGTTYSGYAYSFLADFNNNPLSVNCMNFVGKGKGQGLQSVKEPTVALFNPNKEFVAFGKAAEDKYATMCDDDPTEAKTWYYFERFKMELHSRKSLNRETEVLDFTKKKTLPALDVFAASIGHLRGHALEALRARDSNVRESEITWVLTVPAIWDDSARQFMREAATKGGIDGKNLVLALEPEAAAVYCLKFYQANAAAATADLGQAGKRFLTVDCGGGTVDISAFEITQTGSLKQLHRPTGAPCGGTKVDDAFKELLIEIVGFDGVSSFERTEFVQLFREFEKAKASFGKADKVAIKIPDGLSNTLSIPIQKGTIYGEEIKIVRNKLLVSKAIVERFFDESKRGIIEAIKQVLTAPGLGAMNAILLTGGFAESTIIQKAVQSAFPQVLISPSPSATVVMGAVIYGHKPEVVSSRVAPFTYGVDHWPRFIEGKHDPDKKIKVGNSERCLNVFDVFINVHDSVNINTPVAYKTYFPVDEGQTSMDFDIFTSTNRDPSYTTDEGCQKIGEVTVTMPVTTGERGRKVYMTMLVGGTELKVIAFDNTTKKQFSVTCDFLRK